jgi:hypothetical protein
MIACSAGKSYHYIELGLQDVVLRGGWNVSLLELVFTSG